MALPRPVLLAAVGVMLSILSFLFMRAIAAQDPVELSLPAPAANTGAQKAGADAAAGTKQKAPTPPPPRLEDVPRPVATALADGKVVVLLFAGQGAADAATARHFRALSALGSDVHPVRAGLSDFGRYSGIVANLGITQTPAVVIVRPDLTAVPPIEGYVESGYLLQRVRDQLR